MKPPLSEMFNDVYDEKPDLLVEQEREIREMVAKYPDKVRPRPRPRGVSGPRSAARPADGRSSRRRSTRRTSHCERRRSIYHVE